MGKNGKLNRYYFLKRIYSDYLIIFYEKKKYAACFYDNDILSFLNFKNSLKLIDDHHINYIIINNLEIVKIVCWDDNKYRYYFKLIMLLGIVSFIENNIG